MSIPEYVWTVDAFPGSLVCAAPSEGYRAEVLPRLGPDGWPVGYAYGVLVAQFDPEADGRWAPVCVNVDARNLEAAMRLAEEGVWAFAGADAELSWRSIPDA